MTDLLDILPRSSAVKVVRQCQFKRKSWPKSGYIVTYAAQYLTSKAHIEILGCLVVSNDNNSSRSCVKVKVKVVWKRTILSKIVRCLSLKKGQHVHLCKTSPNRHRWHLMVTYQILIYGEHFGVGLYPLISINPKWPLAIYTLKVELNWIIFIEHRHYTYTI